jgi:hypothetical protein
MKPVTAGIVCTGHPELPLPHRRLPPKLSQWLLRRLRQQLLLQHLLPRHRNLQRHPHLPQQQQRRLP